MLKVVFDISLMNKTLISSIDSLEVGKEYNFNQAQDLINSIHKIMNEKLIQEKIFLPYKVIDTDKQLNYKFKGIDIIPYSKIPELLKNIELLVLDMDIMDIPTFINEVKVQYKNENYNYVSDKGYGGSDRLLLSFFDIQKQLNISDYDMHNIIVDPVSLHTFIGWKKGHSAPNSINRKKLEDIVIAFEPNNPKRILLYKKLTEYRNRCEKQKEKTKAGKENGTFRGNQLLKNANKNDPDITYDVKRSLINIGKQFANSFDILSVDDLEEKYIPVVEVKELGYYKEKIIKDNKSMVSYMVQELLKSKVEEHTEMIKKYYHERFEILLKNTQNQERERKYFNWIISNQKKEITVLEQKNDLIEEQKNIIQNELYSALEIINLLDKKALPNAINDSKLVVENKLSLKIESNENINNYNYKNKDNVINKIKRFLNGKEKVDIL